MTTVEAVVTMDTAVIAMPRPNHPLPPCTHREVAVRIPPGPMGEVPMVGVLMGAAEGMEGVDMVEVGAGMVEEGVDTGEEGAVTEVEGAVMEEGVRMGEEGAGVVPTTGEGADMEDRVAIAQEEVVMVLEEGADTEEDKGVVGVAVVVTGEGAEEVAMAADTDEKFLKSKASFFASY